MTRAAVLAFVLAAAGCVRLGYKVNTFEHANWRTGGLVFQGWTYCHLRDRDCSDGDGAIPARAAAERILNSSCPKGWELALSAAPGLSIVATPPTEPPTTITSLPISGAQGSMLLYRCKP
jgi:hypothetical protein